MARVKQTVVQRDFSFMEIREDFLEGDDLDIRRASLKDAKNMRSLATRTMENRPGTFYMRALWEARQLYEIRPASGLKFGLIVNDFSIQVFTEDGDVVFVGSPVPWSDGNTVWVEGFRDTILLGCAEGIRVLTYANGAFAMTTWQFDTGLSGNVSQPYWVFDKGVTIQPSATTGTVTITADSAIFTNQHVGLRIRYARREIEVTNRVSSFVVEGTVVDALPPSFELTVNNATEFRVGEVLVGQDTNYQGEIVSIDTVANTLKVVTLSFFDGPDVSEQVSSPSGSSDVTAKTSISPEPTTIWDEPLMSDLRGWPRAAGTAAGRLVLLDFEEALDVVAISSSRDITDFAVGTDDDDAIARNAGDNSPRWLHAVSMGDLLLLADNGVYFVPMRENGVLTPSTFNVINVDETGASEVRPVKVEDGVVFIEAGGEGVSAALLDGNVYLKWSVRSMTEFHQQLINAPIGLCGPSLASGSAEKYLLVINGDGTIAAISWQQSIRQERIGFVPWETDGDFTAAAPLFGGYWAIVERTINGSVERMLERFSNDAFVDSTIEGDSNTFAATLQVNGSDLELNGEPLMVNGALIEHLPGETVSIYARGWDVGDFVVQSDGTITDEPVFSGTRQYGLRFESVVAPWPVEAIESPRIGTLTARVLGCFISVQDTLGFNVQLNGYSSKVTAYEIGADLTQPPVPRTKIYHFNIFGNRDHPEITFTRSRPGPFRVLAIGQRVQA